MRLVTTEPIFSPQAPKPDGSCETAVRRLSQGHDFGHEAPMAEFDIESLSLKELKSLQKDLAKAISIFEDRQKSAC